MPTHRGYNSWLARAMFQKVHYNLGTFKTKEEAVKKEQTFKKRIKESA